MIIDTRKVLAAATLIVAVGVGTIEIGRDPAKASAPAMTESTAEYPRSRIEAAFAAAAEVPPMEFAVVGSHGEAPLPVGCDGPFRPEVRAECLDVAAQVSGDFGAVLEGNVRAAAADLVSLDAFDLASF